MPNAVTRPVAWAVMEASAAVSLKLGRHDGLSWIHKVAAVADAASIGLYGSCLRRGSVAASCLKIFSTFRTHARKCENFNPPILTDDLVHAPLRFADFGTERPAGTGICVTCSAAQQRRFARQ
ncbi:hypothetical protein [uncultured Methylobacterium sp.]|uniref:hypothetical protein n=1 Tax=uncultured Methylobacterium sp. TaxID=157278 RepID=UPI00260ABB4A|nr:hypothetical protein [uncultured Methylobacterium sp.]